MRRILIFLFILASAWIFYWADTNNVVFDSPLEKPINFLFNLDETDDQNTSRPLPGFPSAYSGIKDAQLKPTALTIYSTDAPAPGIALLKWTRPPGSVYYEIEFLTSEPENPNAIYPSVYQFFSSREVFTNGYSFDSSQYAGDHFFWRVRGLDIFGDPVGVFSDAVPLLIDESLPQVLKPVSNTGYKDANLPMPLYPVYSWLPVAGAEAYEVELTDNMPENPNDTSPSRSRVRVQTVKNACECYDEKALSVPGNYYWRVRGLDRRGSPIGVYSDAEEFTVSLSAGKYACTLGDSITHGGGAISYSPADCEYSYQSYLSFPTMNLAYSGDTSAYMLARFERDVMPFKPQYLIIMDGTNSLREGVPASDVISDLAVLRDKCLRNDIRPIFLTLPPINPENILRAFNQPTASDWQEQFAATNAFIREQTYFIDIEPYLIDSDGRLPYCYGIDGIHLDIEGKKLIAQIINNNWSQVTQ